MPEYVMVSIMFLTIVVSAVPVVSVGFVGGSPAIMSSLQETLVKTTKSRREMKRESFIYLKSKKVNRPRVVKDTNTLRNDMNRMS